MFQIRKRSGSSIIIFGTWLSPFFFIICNTTYRYLFRWFLFFAYSMRYFYFSSNYHRFYCIIICIIVCIIISSVISITVCGIACIIINLVVKPFGVPAIAVLNLPIIGIMLGLSVLLSVLSGLIPSMHASRQDPVIALRSE